jgi:hypothetical protein
MLVAGLAARGATGQVNCDDEDRPECPLSVWKPEEI